MKIYERIALVLKKINVININYLVSEESTPSNRRRFYREVIIFNSVELNGDKLRQISIYDRMTNAEKEVADLLNKMGIKWTFEQPVFVWDENKRPRVWAPDFLLKQFGIYIEVCGSSDFNYKYRHKIFNKNGYYVIFLHLYKQKEKWKYHLIRSIQHFITVKESYLIKVCKNKKINYLC